MRLYAMSTDHSTALNEGTLSMRRMNAANSYVCTYMTLYIYEAQTF